MTLVRLDALELDELLRGVGFAGARLRCAWAVAMRESRGTPGIIGGPNANGSYDWGLFQVNDVHRANQSVDWSRILEGRYNAGLAFGWTDGGLDWSVWGIGTEGWAGHLKDSAPSTWLRVQEAYLEQFDAYPAALEAATELRSRPGVSLARLKPGNRAETVRTYQAALREYLRLAGLDVAALNPSGPTGYYGRQTETMTKAAYEFTSRRTGSSAWLTGNLSVPGPSLISRIGLRMV